MDKRMNVQTPRPANEKRKEAYRETWGGIWNSILTRVTLARAGRMDGKSAQEARH
jgi:hypothetical protein